MIKLNTLEDFDNLFIEGERLENDGLWIKGGAMFAAREAGFSHDDICRRASGLSRRSRRTVQNYMATYAAFPTEDSRNPELNWSIHALCATTDDPRGWLAFAADKDCSVRDLKAAIKASGGDPDKDKPVWVLDNEPVTLAKIVQQDTMTAITFLVDTTHTDVLKLLQTYSLSLVEVQTPALLAA